MNPLNLLVKWASLTRIILNRWLVYVATGSVANRKGAVPIELKIQALKKIEIFLININIFFLILNYYNN